MVWFLFVQPLVYLNDRRLHDIIHLIGHAILSQLLLHLSHYSLIIWCQIVLEYMVVDLRIRL